MSATGTLSADDLDELEDHAREEAAALERGGLSAAEAWLVAAHRLGEARPLGDEYAQAVPQQAWRQRLPWMLAGYVALTLFWLLVRLVAASVPVVGAWLGAGALSLAIGAGLAVAAGCAVLVLTARAFERGALAAPTGLHRRRAALVTLPLIVALPFAPHLVRIGAPDTGALFASADAMLRFAGFVFPVFVTWLLVARLDAPAAAAEPS